MLPTQEQTNKLSLLPWLECVILLTAWNTGHGCFSKVPSFQASGKVREGRLTAKIRTPKSHWPNTCGLIFSRCISMQLGKEGSAPQGHSGPGVLPPCDSIIPQGFIVLPGTPLQLASRPEREQICKRTPTLNCLSFPHTSFRETQSHGST